MANSFSKRLARIEELLASRLNRRLAFLWLDEGVTREEACMRAGYDVSMIDRIRFVRWLTKEEAGIDPPSYSWDRANEPGPPEEAAVRSDPAPDPALQADPLPRPTLSETALDPIEEDIDRRAARRLTTEKLAEATKAFAKTIA